MRKIFNKFVESMPKYALYNVLFLKKHVDQIVYAIFVKSQ